MWSGCDSPPAEPPIPSSFTFDDSEVEAPVHPTPPPEIHLEGDSLFSLDVETSVIEARLQDGPQGARLTEELASNGGKRAILYRPSADGPQELVAEPGWHILPAGAVDEAGNLLVCWNRLTGPETAKGAMPHPSAGLALICRYRSGGKWGTEIVAGADVPSWLQTIRLDGDNLVVRYHRNPSGWLVNDVEEGDGIWERRLVAGSFEEPVEVDVVVFDPGSD
jgi:hypothetical protein